MDTRKIGSLDVSVIGLGCNNFGGRIDEAATKRVVDAAIAAGVTFFDTADIYGGTRSEEFLGRVLEGRRDAVVIATKFGMAAKDTSVTGGARPEYVRRALEDSLRRLRTDHVDLYQLHEPDANTPVADTLGALHEAVEAGLVREIGCSNFSVAQLEEAAAASRQHGWPRFASVQNEYSLLRREPERGVLAACARLGVAFLPYYPLFAGILTGKYRRDEPNPAGTRVTGAERWEKHLTHDLYDLLEELAGYAADHGRELLDLAFAWLLAEPAVASVIAGATSASQVERNARSAAWRLTPAERATVTDLLAARGF